MGAHLTKTAQFHTHKHVCAHTPSSAVKEDGFKILVKASAQAGNASQ